AIVRAEALTGVRLAGSAVRAARRRARLEAVRLHAEIVPFTPEIAEHYADIYAELAHAGPPIRQNDLAVAATGRSLGFPVLVGRYEEQHFARVDGLDVRVLDARDASAGG
ncbi:MAG: type II toxin-antitoxin system VapC family toxin, partial [Spirochaetota bacterium]